MEADAPAPPALLSEAPVTAVSWRTHDWLKAQARQVASESPVAEGVKPVQGVQKVAMPLQPIKAERVAHEQVTLDKWLPESLIQESVELEDLNGTDSQGARGLSQSDTPHVSSPEFVSFEDCVRSHPPSMTTQEQKIEGFQGKEELCCVHCQANAKLDDNFCLNCGGLGPLRTNRRGMYKGMGTNDKFNFTKEFYEEFTIRPKRNP